MGDHLALHVLPKAMPRRRLTLAVTALGFGSSLLEVAKGESGKPTTNDLLSSIQPPTLGGLSPSLSSSLRSKLAHVSIAEKASSHGCCFRFIFTSEDIQKNDDLTTKEQCVKGSSKEQHHPLEGSRGARAAAAIGWREEGCPRTAQEALHSLKASSRAASVSTTSPSSAAGSTARDSSGKSISNNIASDNRTSTLE